MKVRALEQIFVLDTVNKSILNFTPYFLLNILCGNIQEEFPILHMWLNDVMVQCEVPNTF